MAVKYGRGKFQPPQAYVDYMNMIADSPNYKGLPAIREENGKINWQCSSGKTTSFYKYFPARFEWWVKKADELGIPGSGNSDDRLTVAARMIHPTKKKICLVCGQARYIGYMYINANCAKSWNKILNEDVFTKATPVYSAIAIMVDRIGVEATRKLVLSNFPEKEADIDLFDAGDYEGFFLKTQHIRSTKLSPGYMGDCPHRLDGIHDYCTFCRKKSDPGRSDENMSTYNHDRRAFMWWAEGDWKVADAIYNKAGTGKCANCGKIVKKVSPDHVGPLACGFKQNGFFEPLCGRCNSAKNRRFTYDNVRSLIAYETETDESVASWQVKVLWDKTKEFVCNDNQAKELSNCMRTMQDCYLRILGKIYSMGYTSFLLSILHPEYAYFDIEIEGLDTSTFTYSTVNKKLSSSNGLRNLAARSVRIAFEELLEYCKKNPEKRKAYKMYNAIFNADSPKVERLFTSVALTEEDLNIKKIIDAVSLSAEEKDKKIQLIIEQRPLNERRQEYKSLFDELKEIIVAREINLASKFLNK